MKPQNAFIFNDFGAYGDTRLDYPKYMLHSFISILTLDSLVEWNNTLNMRRN